MSLPTLSIARLLKSCLGTSSLAVQWLRLHASSAGGMGSIPGWRTKIPHATWWPKKNNNKVMYFWCVYNYIALFYFALLIMLNIYQCLLSFSFPLSWSSCSSLPPPPHFSTKLPFPLLTCRSSLYILDKSLFPMYYKYILLFCGLFFHYFNDVLIWRKVCNFNIVKFIIFLLYGFWSLYSI